MSPGPQRSRGQGTAATPRFPDCRRTRRSRRASVAGAEPSAAAASLAAWRLATIQFMTVLVVAGHDVRGQDRRLDVLLERIGNRRGQSPGQSPSAEKWRSGSGGSASRKRRCSPRSGVDTQLVTAAPHDRKNLASGQAHRTDWHHQRVDQDVLPRDPVIQRPFDDLRATLSRTSGSSEMPVSSFEIPITAAPYFFIKGTTISSRSPRRSPS